ncbi:MAG: GNAT family N-acetyltransferase [Haloferacaceae archaeon]
MSSDPVIRAATSDDVDRLVDLWVALAAEQRPHGSHLPPDANRTAAREAIAHRVVTDGVRVAVHEDAVVGFVTFRVEAGRYEQDVERGVVDDLFVVPDHRNAGVGARLLDAAEAALRAAGVDAVALEALSDNAAARRFYERRGYRPHRVEFEKGLENDTSGG